MAMLAIDVQADFGDFRLDASLDLAESGVTALFGPSGAGKTSLIDAVAGLYRPARGRIVLDGTTLFDAQTGVDLAPDLRRLGYVFQGARLFPHLTVEDNLRFGFRRIPESERRLDFARVVTLLALDGMLERRPGTLSAGERQRVAIGRALLASPRLLLMDEPLAALDAGLKAEILPFIQRLHEKTAVPIVYVSHDLDEVLAIADTLALMVGGRITNVGPVAQVASMLTGRDEGASVFETVVEAHDEADGITELRTGGGTLRVARLDRELGSPVRVRIHARDVALSLGAPQNISILNALPGSVRSVRALSGVTVEVEIGLEAGGTVRAHVTPRSARTLALETGTRVFALIKTVAIDRYGGGNKQ